jgi:hypothetical protein
MALHQHVFVHIWDGDNANVYGSRKAAIEGIYEGQTMLTEKDDESRAAVVAAVDQAAADPGEAAYLDDGLSAIRYLHINYEVN